ncbi:MAG: hypothetical protein IJ793_01910 [Opitutales bacterium]|nr:hypothetical protein [Opitutales bacterium]
MKKVLNISTVQQALRRLPIAFLIAGSGFLPNASAVRYTIDFQGKAVDPQKCECFFKLLGDYKYYSPKDYWSRFNSENCKLSIENKEEDDSYDVVFKNGSITKEESQKFPEANVDSLTFDGCKGELDLSEIFQRSVGKILMEKCNFTIAENCFKYTENFEPNNSKLLLENGLFSIPDEIEDWNGNARIILPKRAEFANNTTLEAPLSIPFKAAVSVLQHGLCTLGYYYGHIEFEEFSLIRTENEKLRKELESVREEHKAEIEKLQRNLDKEKDKRISGVNSLQAQIKDAQKACKKTKEELKEKNSKVATLLQALSVAQNEFETAKFEKEKCEKTNAALKEKIRNFEIKCKLLESSKKNLGFQMKELQASNSELKKANENLGKENDELKEEISRRLETIQLAEEAVKRNKELTKANEKLRDAKEEANNTVKKLNKDIKTLKKYCKITTEWADYNVSLIGDMKKLGTIGNVKVFLNEAGYWKKQQETKEKLEGNEDSKNLKTKKGKWLEFDPISFINNTELNESKEEEEEKEEPKKESKDYFEIRTDNFKEDYFDEKENFQNQEKMIIGGSKKINERGNQRNYRGRYQNNFQRGRGKMMVHKPRGRGRPQYDPNYYQK